MRYRKAIITNGYTILQDDREKAPWTCLHRPVLVKRLKTGDYSIRGWESQIAIEKKSGFVEVLTNLSAPSRARFVRFLERLRDYPVRVMVIEQALTEAAVCHAVRLAKDKSGGKCRLGPETLWHWLTEMEVYYQIPVVMVDRAAVPIVVPRILEAAWRRVKGA